MNTDQRNPGTDNAAERGKSGGASRPIGIRQALREIREGIVVMWWRFFDWLAVVSWKTLLLVSFLGLIIVRRAYCKLPTLVFLLIVASFIIKVVAGGKRRAELTASEATKRAETEQLERTVLEARMEALQAQIEPHFLFNTLAQHRPAHPDRPAARLQDAAEPDPLPALGDAADARRQPAHAGSAGQSLQRLPGNHGGANGRTPAAGRERAGRLEIGGLPVDDVADAGGKRHQARPGTEARGRPARDRRRDRRWPAGGACARTPASASCRKPKAAWDWPIFASG